MTTEKKIFLNVMKIDGEINFSDLCRKSGKKSCYNKKIHNLVKSQPFEFYFFCKNPHNVNIKGLGNENKIVSLKKNNLLCF